MTRVRVAWFTPLQPVESGISLYSEDILPHISRVVDVDVIVEGYRPTRLAQTSTLRVRDYREFESANYDLVVYQVGNSPVHVYMLPEARRTPGLMILHDTMLNHLFIQEAARNGTLLRYRDEMEHRYGPEGRRAAERVLKGQAPDDLFRFPMSEMLVEQSRATIVHSRYARDQVLRQSPSSDVFRVPHGLVMPEYIDRSYARQALCIPEDQFIIASISHINPHKRIDVVLRALKELRRRVPARLILAGSVSPQFPLARMISHLGLDQVVETPGYVSHRDARLIAAAADVIVNLRYPTAGETSGSLLHSMAAGRPVLVSQTGSFTEVPDSAAIRLPVDALEERMLVTVFEQLAEDPALGTSIGLEARRFVEEEHSMQRWVDGYIDVISLLTGAEIEKTNIYTPYECIDMEPANAPARRSDTILDSVARDLAELGLGGDRDLMRDVATAQVELGIGVGIITDDADHVIEQPGGQNDD